LSTQSDKCDCQQSREIFYVKLISFSKQIQCCHVSSVKNTLLHTNALPVSDIKPS